MTKTLDEVIKALECCDTGENDSRCGSCPYIGVWGCCHERKIDALTYLKMYRSDQIQYDADRKNWEEIGIAARDRYEAAAQKHIDALKEKSRTATAPWNPDRNRYCCDQCGAYIGKYDKYCNGCGARLTDWTPDGRGKRK